MKWIYENIKYSVISFVFFSVNSNVHFYRKGDITTATRLSQEPPDYPIFSNTTKKVTKSASELTQALTEVADATYLPMLNR